MSCPQPTPGGSQGPVISRRTALQALTAGLSGAPGILHGARRAGNKSNLLFLRTVEQRADNRRNDAARPINRPQA